MLEKIDLNCLRHGNNMANRYHSVKLRKNGHSYILTVPRNAVPTHVREYIPYCCMDGSLIFRPIVERKERKSD